jgi:hypothetical protein
MPFCLLGYRNLWRLLERLSPAYISDTSANAGLDASIRQALPR